MRPGDSIGTYRILDKLGEGGMGEVYRATDTRLKRDVAIKVLPAAFTADPERLARFEREAQVLAQLHHPNIASIFGLEEADGVRALVMELVEGPTLADRLEQGRLPVDESLAIARQIAEALEDAHERGIVHRDLKPQNIKAATDGKVKVLDFGLAKAMDPTAGSAASAADLARSPTMMHSPTLTAAHGTQLGVILGTAAYMAPEQARGGAIDKRADIWAFGVVLYEMLTGRQLFAGDTVSDTLAGVLRAEVDWTALPAATPPAIRRLLRRCLERNPKNRLHDIADARLVLDDQVAGRFEEAASPPPARRPLPLRALPWALVAVLAGGLAWALSMQFAGSGTVAASRSPVLALRLPPQLVLQVDEHGLLGQVAIFAIAPDGSRIAFAARGEREGLHLRELDGAEVRYLEGTERASSPFFSPDGRWLAFFSPGKMSKIAVEGGRPVDLAEASLDRGGTWCPDGSIVFAPAATSGLFRLRAGSTTPEPLTRLAEGERTHRWPAVLPGGREVAFTIGSVGQPGDYESSQIDAVDLESGRRRPLFRGASMVRFTPDGVALLGRNKEVLALPLAGAAGRSTEEARTVLRNVAGIAASGVVFFDVAMDGTLVYAERNPRADAFRLAWFATRGEPQRLDLPDGPYRRVRISPDGTRVAIAAGPGGGRGGDIWILDLAGGTPTKLTFDGKSDAPVWSPDGRSVTFQTTLPNGAEEIRQRLADGSRPPDTLAHFPIGRARAPVAWMHDGSLLFWEDSGAGSGGDLLFVPGGGGEPRPFVATPAVENLAAVSPDRRWVAYSVFATGRSELHVEPFPPSGAKWLVDEAGVAPMWSPDGRELYFTRDRELFAVAVDTRGSFTAGVRRKVLDFPAGTAITDDTAVAYDVARDGRVLAPTSASTDPIGDHLVVILDWFSRLRNVR
jgi:dipeptidyl aminopeptidase/acylaminoacyl peptidase